MADHEILALAKTIRYDLTSLQAKLTELIRLAALLEAPDPNANLCQVCGLRFKGSNTLAEHLYVQHDGPEPDHWLQAEAQADLPDDSQSEPERANLPAT